MLEFSEPLAAALLHVDAGRSATRAGQAANKACCRPGLKPRPYIDMRNPLSDLCGLRVLCMSASLP